MLHGVSSWKDFPGERDSGEGHLLCLSQEREGLSQQPVTESSPTVAAVKELLTVEVDQLTGN